MHICDCKSERVSLSLFQPVLILVCVFSPCWYKCLWCCTLYTKHYPEQKVRCTPLCIIFHIPLHQIPNYHCYMQKPTCPRLCNCGLGFVQAMPISSCFSGWNNHALHYSYGILSYSTLECRFIDSCCYSIVMMLKFLRNCFLCYYRFQTSFILLASCLLVSQTWARGGVTFLVMYWVR